VAEFHRPAHLPCNPRSVARNGLKTSSQKCKTRTKTTRFARIAATKWVSCAFVVAAVCWDEPSCKRPIQTSGNALNSMLPNRRF
jgi:hypothetical protein